MNIAFVGPFALAPKSTMRVRALPIAQELVRRGHRVTVLLPPWDNPDDSGAIKEDDGVRIENLSLPRRIPLVESGLLAARLLSRTLACRAGVVHVFKPKGFSGVVAQVLLRNFLPSPLRERARGRTRVLVDTDDWEGAGGWNDRGGYPWWQRACFSYQERWLLRHADAVTAASETLTRMARALRHGRRPEPEQTGTLAGPQPPGGVVYLPNGPSTFSPCPTPDPALRSRLGLGEGPAVLLLTRFVESPPGRTASMLAAIPVPYTLLLVGTGLRGEEHTFLREMHERRVPVVHTGWVEPQDLPPYLGLADVAVFPMEDSLLNRAKCSVKLVDLLSAGVPVVAEAVGQSREYIVDGESGVLVPPGDLGAFGSAVAGLLQDPGLRRRLGDGGRARISGSFSWERLVDRLENQYTAAIGASVG